MEEKPNISMRDVSRMLGTTSSAIRLYCNKGLVPNVKHTITGYRIFTAEQVDWLRALLNLRKIGMGIDELKRYVTLCRKGDSTIPERKAMLETKKRQLWQELEDIHAGIDFIERKTEVFDKAMSGEDQLPSEWF